MKLDHAYPLRWVPKNLDFDDWKQLEPLFDELEKNADGSFDMYFGPTAQPGQESNWIETVPGRGFYVFYRLYSPTEGLFDGTWALPDVELT